MVTWPHPHPSNSVPGVESLVRSKMGRPEWLEIERKAAAKACCSLHGSIVAKEGQPEPEMSQQYTLSCHFCKIPSQMMTSPVRTDYSLIKLN